MRQMSKQRKLDLHKMHDGMWCALILPMHSNRAIARGFARTPMQAVRAALKVQS
jgi:hypothetical protein